MIKLTIFCFLGAVGLIFFGVKGIVDGEIRFSEDRDLEGGLARGISIICVVLGIAGFLWTVYNYLFVIAGWNPEWKPDWLP